ncbi:hypothetical protein M5689_020960 [Euphorbia peplus]|nr:hypothetical protein M5689_020960 [Euphorbia peplus]
MSQSGNNRRTRVAYISELLRPALKEDIIRLLHEFKDCFSWNYDEMPRFSRNIVEHKLPIKTDFKPFKQASRRMSKEVEAKVKEEIKKLLKSGFIRPAKYVEWLSNVVPVVKKNGKLRVCVDFCDINHATPKDIYVMPITDTLVDVSKNAIISCADCFAGYNQIQIAENDVSKTAF